MSDAPVPAAPAAPEPPVSASADSLFSNTVIITYPNHQGPYNIIVDDLLDYLWNMYGQTVHTYLVLKDVASWDPITKTFRTYAKVVDTPAIKMTHVRSTANLCGIKSDLMIILGHGHGDDDTTDQRPVSSEKTLPASIQFYDRYQYGGLHYDDFILYADSQTMAHKQSTSMKLVTGHSKLLILGSCYGNKIVPLYLADMTRDVHKARLPLHAEGEPIHSPKKQKTHHTPEAPHTRQMQHVLYFDIDSQLVLCVEILLLLMISMADGQWEIPDISPAECVTPIILRIMQMVRLFEQDADGLWKFLQEVGCVVLLEDVKKQQQQPIDWPKNSYFRVGGHKFTQILDDSVKADLLEGLRALTLVTWTADEGLNHNLTRSVKGDNPPDIQFDARAKDGSDKHVDKFLRDYHAKKNRKPFCVVSAAAPSEPLMALLAQLRTLEVHTASVASDRARP
jgi:hypothetical protein